jgi:hypothetical protein
VIPTKSTSLKIKSRRNFGKIYQIFPEDLNPFLKFIKDSNIQSVPGFLNIFVLGI